MVGAVLDCWVVGGECDFGAVKILTVCGAICVGIVEDARDPVFAAQVIDGLEEVG